jgi:putative transposase
MVSRAFKFVLEPKPDVADRLAQHAGAARFAFNWGVEQIGIALDARAAQKAAGQALTVEIPKHFDLCKMWTVHKDRYRTEPDPGTGRDLSWVAENAVCVYQTALRDAARAWSNFFDSRTGRRTGRRMGRPKFKSKHRSRPAFQMHGDSLYFRDAASINLPRIGPVTIPKLLRVGRPISTSNRWVPAEHGWIDRNRRRARTLTRLLAQPAVPCPEHRATVPAEPPAKPKKCPTCRGEGTVPAARIVRANITQSASGLWWCSVTADVVMTVPVGPSRRQRAGGIVGLDLGTRFLAVDSDGGQHHNPAHLDAALAELRVAQRAFSRCQPDSNRRAKARLNVGRIHERVALARKDYIDRLSDRLTRAYAGIAVEGWNASALASKPDETVPARVRRQRNRKLADASPGILRWQLAYKAGWRGVVFSQSDSQLQSARTCSACGAVRTKPVPLTETTFRCDACGVSLDRRVNSARVVRNTLIRPAPDGPAPEPATG